MRPMQKKTQLSVEGRSNIISVIQELSSNNLAILKTLPCSNSSLVSAVRHVCRMQRAVINEMETIYYNGEDMDVVCIMGHAKTMQENSSKLIPLVGNLPPLALSKVKDFDLSIAKLRLCCFDMSYVYQSARIPASSSENYEGRGSLGFST